jgi:hypothetical protein
VEGREFLYSGPRRETETERDTQHEQSSTSRHGRRRRGGSPGVRERVRAHHGWGPLCSSVPRWWLLGPCGGRTGGSMISRALACLSLFQSKKNPSLNCKFSQNSTNSKPPKFRTDPLLCSTSLHGSTTCSSLVRTHRRYRGAEPEPAEEQWQNSPPHETNTSTLARGKKNRIKPANSCASFYGLPLIGFQALPLHTAHRLPQFHSSLLLLVLLFLSATPPRHG